MINREEKLCHLETSNDQDMHMDDDDIIILGDSSDSSMSSDSVISVAVIEPTIPSRSSVVDRGNVSFANIFVSDREIISDGKSIYYENNTLLSEDALAEPNMKNSLLAGSEKLSRFLKQKGSACDSILGHTDIQLEEYLRGVTDKFAKKDVILTDLFEYQCQASSSIRPKYNFRFFDDASFNYSNAGIIYSKNENRIVNEKTTWDSMKKFLRKTDVHVDPSSSSERTSETLKIRIPKVLIPGSSSSSPLVQVATSSDRAPDPILQTHSLINEGRRISTNKITIDKNHASVSKSKSSKDETRDPVKRKKKRHCNDIDLSAKLITGQKPAEAITTTPLKSPTFLDALNAPSSVKSLSSKNGTGDATRKAKHIRDPRRAIIPPGTSSHGSVFPRRSTTVATCKPKPASLSESATPQYVLAGGSSTVSRVDDMLDSIFAILDKQEIINKGDHKNGPSLTATKSNLQADVNSSVRQKPLSALRQHDILSEPLASSTECAVAPIASTPIYLKPVFDSPDHAIANTNRLCLQSIGSPVGGVNTNDTLVTSSDAAASQIEEMEHCDAAFNVFSMGVSSPTDGHTRAIPGLTPPRLKKDNSSPMAEVTKSQTISSTNQAEKLPPNGQDVEPRMSPSGKQVQSVLSEISLDLTNQFVSSPVVNKLANDFTEDPADDDIEEPSTYRATTNCLVNNDANLLDGDPSDDIMDDPADEVIDDDSGSGIGPDQLNDDPADEMEHNILDELEVREAVPAGSEELEEPTPCGSPETVQQRIHEESDANVQEEVEELEEPSPCVSEDLEEPSHCPSLTSMLENVRPLETDNVPANIDDLEEPEPDISPITANVNGETYHGETDELEEPSSCVSPSKMKKLIEEHSRTKKFTEDSGYSVATPPDYLEEPSPRGSPSAVRQLVQENAVANDHMEDPADEITNETVPIVANDQYLDGEVANFMGKSLKIKRETVDDGYVDGATGLKATMEIRLAIKREVTDDGYGDNMMGNYASRRALYLAEMEDPADETLDMFKRHDSPTDDLARYRALDSVHLEDDPADDDPYFETITLSDDEDDDEIEIIDVVPGPKSKAGESSEEDTKLNAESVSENVPPIYSEIKVTNGVEKSLEHIKLEDDKGLMKMIRSIKPGAHEESLLAGEVSMVNIEQLEPQILTNNVPGPRLPEFTETEYFNKKLREFRKTMCGKPVQSTDYLSMKGYITAAEQLTANLEARNSRDGFLSYAERRVRDHLREKPVNKTLDCIPVYRPSQAACRLIYPFEKCDGLYWPVIQPSDAININILKDIHQADVINQMYNHSCYTHERLTMFLADPESSWNKDYAVAKGMTDAQMKERGRFRYRIGFKRVGRIENDDVGRENDRKNQEREQKWLESLPEDMVQDVDKYENRKMTDNERVCRANDMRSHVEFNLVDEYSSERFQGQRTARNSAIDDWITPPSYCYVPANDRREYLCIYTNWVNADIHKYMELLRFPHQAISVRVIRSALRAAFCYQTQTSLFLCHTNSAALMQRRTEIISLTKDLKKREAVKVCDLLKHFELRSYEYAYWPIIWDSLVSNFKKYPFVSQMSQVLRPEIDKAFRRVARVDEREAYFDSYLDKKKAHIQLTCGR